MGSDHDGDRRAPTGLEEFFPGAAPPPAPHPLIVTPAPKTASPFVPAATPATRAPTPSVMAAGDRPGIPAQAATSPAAAAGPPSTAADPLRKATGEADDPDDGVHLTPLLIAVLERGASDLHITSGAPPTLRINGVLAPMADMPLLTPPMLQRMLYALITQKQRERFEEELELDFAYAVPGKARFRVNLYMQRESLGAAFRLIPFGIKPLEELGVPPIVSTFAMLPRGFVLVTGPTGSGKSTTLAAVLDLANRQRHEHIMTVEDPIEVLHEHRSCLVNQREVGEDTKSFGNALKHVLRQDPDIILVGEMRDLETISVALTAAETGHLVLATLHTQDAAQTIDRIIDVFPPHQQQQVRVQLAGSLQGGGLSGALPDRRWKGPSGGLRGAVRHSGDPQPHPRGQDAPDLLRAAGGSKVRHDHDGPEPGGPGQAREDHTCHRGGEVPPRRRLQPVLRPDLTGGRLTPTWQPHSSTPYETAPASCRSARWRPTRRRWWRRG